MSTGVPKNSVTETWRAWAYPATPPVAATWVASSSASIPSGFAMEPVWSLTARSLAPPFCMMRAAWEPTFPYPCTMNVEPLMSKPRCFAHTSRQYTRPCPVALSRPTLPPFSTLLPVTTRRVALRSDALNMVM